MCKSPACFSEKKKHGTECMAVIAGGSWSWSGAPLTSRDGSRWRSWAWRLRNGRLPKDFCSTAVKLSFQSDCQQL